jgi:hypothetical protein
MDFEQVLRRPIETAPLIGMWEGQIPSYRESRLSGPIRYCHLSMNLRGAVTSPSCQSVVCFFSQPTILVLILLA